MNARQFLTLLSKHFAARQRRVWMGEGRAHIELRSVDSHELLEVGEHLSKQVQRLPELHWAEVHQGTGRAVLAFKKGSLTEAELVGLVTEAELRAGVSRAEFEGREHPGDVEPSEALLLELIADAIGLVVGSTLKISFLPRSGLAVALESGLAVVKTVPRLRRPLEERWGKERTELGLALAIGVLHGPAQRPLNALVGLVEKGALGAERVTQRKLWDQREHALCPGPGASLPRPVPQRPVPLPRGPIEDYADRAWAVALGGFGVSFISTRSVQRAFGALFGGLPRPAKLGREIFSAALSRLLASRQMLVLDRDALRRLDRIDCLVLQGDLMPGGAASIGRIAFNQDVDEEAARRAAERLFDSENPLAVRESDGYRLAPLGRSQVGVPAGMKAEARTLSQSGELVVSLDRNGQLLALVEIRIRSRVGLEELVEAAHDASMRVIVASNDPDVLQSVPADDTLGAGDALWRGVRELQREGRVVCVVAQGDSRALDVADLAVALVPPGAQVPWSAHILCRDDLTDVRLLIESSRTAHDVSRQSVNVALGAASLGALASVGGILPMTTSRVLTVVNTASLLSMANGFRLAADFGRKPLPPARDPTPWHALDPQGVMRRLGTRPEGLARSDALARYRETDNRKGTLSELTGAISDELFNPLVPLLAAGAGLSAVAGSVADSMMVGGVVVLNAAIGGVQRFRTERAIDELTQMTKIPVLVRRDGKEEQIDSDRLVKGDVILLSSGDIVPADCRIVEASGLEVDASGLTGESLPVPKSADASFDEAVADRKSMLYAGTTIATGQATAVVVAIGTATEAQRGAVAFRTPVRTSGVEQRMRQLMDLTAPVALASGIGVVGVGLLRGRKMDELVGSAVSLAVASVPEGLPLLATAAQLAAARRLRAHGALVRNVRSLEALGRVDTVCLDKTGTMTEGSIVLGQVSDGFVAESVEELGEPRRNVLAAALRASPPRPGDLGRADPVDAALFRETSARELSVHQGIGEWQRISEIPFEAERSYAAVLGRTDAGSLVSVKGAPEALLSRCKQLRREGKTEEITPELLEQIKASAHELALSGLRVLAVAEHPFPEGDELSPESLDELTFLGLLAFRDPVRKTARQALVDLRRAGLRAIMVTGDHPSTASAIAVEINLSATPEVMTGADLANLDDDELATRVLHVDVFARVSPSQKVRIVRALSRAGRTVAMVGDGANDAPAIRLANVGVAMGQRAAEAARNAADIVLVDARVETLVRAIVEGRVLWDSVRDAVSILVGGNLGEIGFTLFGGLISGRPPLSPRQLLLVNLFTDVAPATVLALRTPREKEMEALSHLGPEASMGWRLDRDIGARALVTASGAGIAWLASSTLGDRRGASTTALLALVGTQLGQTMMSGQRSRQVIATSVLSTLGLALIVQTPGVSGAFGCRPLGPLGWAIAVSSSSVATMAGRYAPDLVENFIRQRSDLFGSLGQAILSEDLGAQKGASVPPPILPDEIADPSASEG